LSDADVRLHILNGLHQEKDEFFSSVCARLLAVMQVNEGGEMTRITKDLWEDEKSGR
jgi:hypothetical protein